MAAGSSSKAVLVVGGGGFYGRYLVDDLLRHERCDVVVASRSADRRVSPHPRLRAERCDLDDLARLTELAKQCAVVVHCAGPFHDLPLNPLRAAIASSAAYVDIAEDRGFARAVESLRGDVEAAGISALSGLSVAPGMEALFAQAARPLFDHLDSVRTFAAPDTRRHRGPAMFKTMLRGVGRGWLQPRGGRLAEVHGWTEPEWVEFPPPIGRRLTYLVLEMADLDVLPRLFHVGTVEFKAGTEHAVLNRLLHVAARIRMRTGHPRWERLTPLVRGLSWLAGRVGRDEGAVLFEVAGRRDGRPLLRRTAVVATLDGGLIPSVLASIAVGDALAGRLRPGWLPLHSWIEPGRLMAELARRGLLLWERTGTDDPWLPLGAAASLGVTAGGAQDLGSA